MRGTRFPSAEEHPPSPPSRGGKSKAKRWGKRHRISAEGCKPDVIQLSIVNCYAGLSEREFRKWARINANNRVCHSERSEESRLERPRRSSLRPRAVSRRNSEQGERKSGCPSEASYLIFRPASVATTCEAHEALIFSLLLDQAKSNGKEIHRFALNDK